MLVVNLCCTRSSRNAFLSDSADRSLRNLAVRDDLVTVHATQLDTIFTYRMSDNGDTCGILVPLELRERVEWVR